MKILFVHEVSYRKKVIFEMHEFPELLALKGHDVHFLEFDEGRRFWDKGLALRHEVIQGRVHSDASLNVFRPFQLGIPGIDRLLATLTVIPQVRKLMKSNVFDAVVLYAVPTYGLQTLWFAKKYQVPVMFRALDVSHKIRSSVLSPAIKWIEKRIYKQVDLLSANNPAMASYCNQLGQRIKDTTVHFPPLDLSHFQTGSRDEPLRKSLGFSDEDRVLVYMGSFFYFSGLNEAIEEFAISATPRDKLLLVGGGEQDKKLKKRVRKLGLSGKVVFTGFVPYEELPLYLGLADIAINTLRSTLVANVALPHKVLQYVSSGREVVSTSLLGLKSVFGDSSLVEWASSPREVMTKALELVANPAAFSKRESSLDEILNKFEATEAVASLERSLLKIIVGPKK